MTIVMTYIGLCNDHIKFTSMKASFFLKSRALADGRKKVGIQFSFARGNQPQKMLDIAVFPQYWDKKKGRVSSEHLSNEDINRTLADYKHRIEIAITKYENKRFNEDAVISHVLKKSDVSSVSNYINTNIKADLPHQSTSQSYNDWWNGFRKTLGKRDKSFSLEDLMVQNLYVKYQNAGNKRIKDGEITTRTYRNYLNVCQKVLNHAFDNNYLYDEFKIPSKFSETKIFTKRDKGEDIEPFHVWQAVDKVNSIQQWQSVSLWLLSFCLRGFYYSDFVALSDNKIVDKKGKSAIRKLQTDVYVDTIRQKSSVPIFTNISRPVLRLLYQFKYSLVYTRLGTEFNGKDILTSINDSIGLCNYDVSQHDKKHNQFWKTFQKKSKNYGLTQKDARKTFNETAQRIEITKETREILLGQVGTRTIEQHYDNYKLPEVVDRVDKAHLEVLNKFKAFDLIKKLTAKLSKLIEAKNLPKWIQNYSGVHKVGREYKILVGYENHKPTWCTIEGKYKDYFKKDKSTEKGFWADEETWFDDKNRIKQNIYDILKQNKWVKEAKRQQKELDIAKKDIKVIQLNKSVKNSSIS